MTTADGAPQRSRAPESPAATYASGYPSHGEPGYGQPDAPRGVGRDFARGGYVPAPVISAADRERAAWRAANAPDPVPASEALRLPTVEMGELTSSGVPHAKLYAAGAWAALVRDVLIILILLAFAFLGGRFVSAANDTTEPAACVEVSTGSSGTVCVPAGD